MENKDVPRLRPNTFLTLLLRAKQEKVSKRPANWQYASEKSPNLTQATLLRDLVHILNTNTLPADDTMSSHTSYLLGGKMPYSGCFPFDKELFQWKAKRRMEEDYKGALGEMDALCRKYLNVGKSDDIKSDDIKSDDIKSDDMEMLVGGLMETILLDDTFSETETFDIGGKRIRKRDLEKQRQISLQPFLLDVWFQVATKYHNSKEAAKTYADWTHQDGAGKKREIITTIGEKMRKKISVVVLPNLSQETSTDLVENEPSGSGSIPQIKSPLPFGPGLQEYLQEQFLAYEAKNIAVYTPQLLLMLLTRPNSKTREIFDQFYFEGKRYSEYLISEFRAIDEHYQKTGRTFSSQCYNEFNRTLSQYEPLPGDRYLTETALCFAILNFGSVNTAKWIEEQLGSDDFKMLMRSLQLGRLPSMPVKFLKFPL